MVYIEHADYLAVIIKHHFNLEVIRKLTPWIRFILFLEAKQLPASGDL